MSSIAELEEMIRHLQTRMVYLEGRVAQLEAGRNPAWPTNPVWPETKSKCPKCGMTLGNVMGYVCAAIDCPTFPKVTSSVGVTTAIGG